MKRKLLKILTIIISIFSFLPILTFAQNNCLNFTGGVGEFEVIDKDEAKKIPLNNYIARPAGWYFSKSNGIDLRLNIDRNIYFNNGFSRGSLKIEINKPDNITTGFAGRLTNYLYAGYPYVSTETENYYPKRGDFIEGRLKIKSNLSNQNLSFRILLVASTTESSGIYLFDRTFTNLTADWSEIVVTSSIPTNQGDLISLRTILEFRFPNSRQSANGVFWLDDYRLYTYRNENCLTLPPKKNSSLKIIEKHHYVPCNTCERNKDFIKLYVENVGWWGDEDDISLIVQYLDPNFKRVPYFLPTVLRRGDLTNNKYCRSTHNSVINQYFDRICIANTTLKTRVHHSANFPDFIERSITTNIHSWWGSLDLRIDLIPESAEIISKNFLNFYKTFYGNSLLQPFTLVFDLFETYRYRDGIFSRQVNQPIFLDIMKKNLFPYIKYIGNLGYGVYADPNEANSGGNWYTQLKFTYGYQNEKLIASDAYSVNPRSAHKQFKSLIENKNLDIIASVGWHGPCDINSTWTNFIIASAYLTNQANTYYSFAPQAWGNYSSLPECHPSSLYLPMGQPLPVEKIDELVVASTTNFSNGGLYKRNYTNGLVLVNTSPNIRYSYSLSNNSEPINFSLYQDQFGNIYDVSQNATTINLPPLTGLILYSPSQNLQNLDLLQ